MQLNVQYKAASLDLSRYWGPLRAVTILIYFIKEYRHQINIGSKTGKQITNMQINGIDRKYTKVLRVSLAGNILKTYLVKTYQEHGHHKDYTVW